MKNSVMFILLIVFLSFQSMSFGQTDGGVTRPPRPQLPSGQTFFLKAGVGTFLYQFNFQNFPDRAIFLGFPVEINTDWAGPQGLVGSLAVGLGFPDYFSFFLSGELMPGEDSFLVNAQYTIADLGPFEPYVYAGLGTELFGQSTLGVCSQLALGVQHGLTKDIDVFIEGRFFGSVGFWKSPNGAFYDHDWREVYFPLTTGLQLKL